jgi:hypothetical protein
MIDQFGQVRVGKIAHDLSFALELLMSFRRGVEVFLEGARPVQVQISGAIHRAETSLPEELDDAIAVVEGLTGG